MTSFLKNDRFLENPRHFLKKSVIFRKTRRVKFDHFCPKSSGVKVVYFSRFFLKKSPKFATSRAPVGVLKNHRFWHFTVWDLVTQFWSFLPVIFDKNSLHFFLKIRGFLKMVDFGKPRKILRKIGDCRDPWFTRFTQDRN